jgi:long-subunit acyl-CoA synthetase (AMP-forming)
VVLGDGRDYLAAMICIRFSIVSKWAEKNRFLLALPPTCPHAARNL